MPEQFKTVHSTMKDVPLKSMRVSSAAQRDLRPGRVAFLASEFDPEQFGNPVVNYRDSVAWIIDGQHRIEAVKQYLGDSWETQMVTCRVYTGMSEKEEADMFDRLNNTLAINAFDKFKVRVTAGRKTECAVKKVVEKQGLKISRDHSEGAVSAVTTLVRVYERADGATLGRSLQILHESFGDPGLSNHLIDGMARVCERYNGAIDDAETIERLRALRGGIGALISRAELLRKQTGVSIPECIAAATIDTMNAKRGGKKLPSWWKA